MSLATRSSAILSAGTLALMLAIPAFAGSVIQPRNDTGQTVCYDSEGESVVCDAPLYPMQDARFGRDAAALDGVLPKVGEGGGGFDFTKIANDGSELPSDTTLGGDPDNWACTRDNVTGLLWEIKSAAGARSYQWSYSWYDPDPATNGGNEGDPNGIGPICGFSMMCNTHAFIDYVNSVELCGRSDWRLPTLDEIVGIVDYNFAYPDGGAMDHNFFADGGGYSGFGGAWTSETGHEPENGDAAWFINFDDGHAEQAPKGATVPVRAVSGHTELTEGDDPRCGERENPEIRATTAGAFTFNDEDRTATDARTGLTWARCAMGQDLSGEGPDANCDGEGESLPWQEAMFAVENRNAEGWLGHDDWRLPNVKELMSIYERRCFGPVVDLNVFPEEGHTYWTSTTYAWYPEQAWALELFGGNAQPTPKNDGYPSVRLVRGGDEFDDYGGTLSFSVGGDVTGMVGGNIELRLETGTGEEEFLPLASNGAFAFSQAFMPGDTWTVSVSQPPVPFQECNVTNDSGTIGSENVTDVTVTCNAPDPAVISVAPQSLSFDVAPDDTASGLLSISNIGGGILSWSIDTAYANSVVPGFGAGISGAAIDCEAEPGIIIHDDGTPENAYAGNSYWPGGIAIVDRFTPPSYPASIRALCVGLVGSAGVSAIDFEIVVLSDNGPGGAPGTEIDSMWVNASGLPQYPVQTPTWNSYDISALYSTITSGSVYVGIRWQPASVNNHVFLLADESDDRPVGYAGGYYWNWGGAGNWDATEIVGGNYRSMFLRAVPAAGQPLPVGCDDPHAVPWLDVSPASAATFAGESDEATVSINTAGIDVGNYGATLCIQSDDPGSPLVEVPVALSVSTGSAQLDVTPTSIEFGEIAAGTSAPQQSVTVSNTGTIALGGVSLGSANAPFSREGGSCPTATFTLQAGESCAADYTFKPVALGAEQQSVTVQSNVGNASFTLAGTGIAGDPIHFEVISGSGQSTAVGQTFATPLVVEVTDAYGNPVSGVDMLFTAPATGASASLSASTVATDTAGRASVTANANTVAGTYQVDAVSQSSGDTVQFELTNVVGGPVHFEVVSGSGQSAAVGQVFATPLVVEVTDAYGNPVSGVDMLFTAPATGASASLSASTVATDTAGRASVTATANTVAGTYQVDAVSQSSGDTVQFELTNVATEPTDRIFANGFEASSLPAGMVWAAGYDGNGKRDDAEAVAVDSEGNVYVAGWSVVESGDNQYATVKYNAEGIQQWAATWDDDDGRWDEAYAIAVDAAGNSYVTGGSYGSNGLRPVTIKYNTDGMEQWVRRASDGNTAKAIGLDVDGNVYVAAISVFSAYVTIKYDPDGNVVWSRSFDAPGANPNNGTRLVVRDGQGIYIGSPVYSEEFGNTAIDYLVVRYDFDGNLVWSSRYFNDAAFFYDVGFAVDSAGNAFIGGGSSDYRIVKFGPNGDVLWSATAGGEGGAITSLAVDAAGNVFSGGIIGCSGVPCFGVMKHDSAGSELWRQTYDPGYGGADNVVIALAVDSSGNLYATGHNVVGPGTLLTEYVTAKYDATTGSEAWLERYTGAYEGYSEGRAIALDPMGNVLVTGRSNWDPTGATNWDFVTIKYGGG